jgi:hypothetical protein
LRFLPVIVFVLLSPSFLRAAAFEPLGYGAAAKGMGGAYVAMAEDGAAAYWNPAGLARVRTAQLTASMEDPYGQGLLRYAAAGYTHPNIGRGTLSAQLLHLETTGDAKFFKYAESTYLVAYGREFCQGCVSLGAGMRYYSANGTQVKGTGVGFDLGALWRPAGDRFRLSVAWQDLNRPEITWTTGAKDRLSYTLRTGGALRLGEATDLSLQYDKRNAETAVWRTGVAHKMFNEMVTLRAGLHRSDDQDEWGVALGGGLRFKKIDVDYAWDNQDSLGNTQTISMALRFGK